ncbi:MAG: ABC transporter substrate-binding protein, partial [Peptococcaceae bacterium]|nr:ABC transporter substrate-binding protein [Peptococcaceae bacterium]
MRMKKSTFQLLIIFMLVWGLALAACGQQGATAPAGQPSSGAGTGTDAGTGTGTAPGTGTGADDQAASQGDAQAGSQTEPVLPVEPAGVIVVDQAGREVAIAGDVERIVSCYYISSSACLALGLADKLVAIESRAADRPIYRLAAPRLLELPNVGSAREFNMEACIEADPDLVILPLRSRDSAETMAGMGIPVLLVSPESHEELVEMITLIGEATGTQAAAARLIGYYNTELAAVAALTAGISDRPSVYMAGNSAFLSTAPRDMYQASVIRSAGGVNASDGLDGNNWVDVSYEQLLAMNPEVIIIPAAASYTRE